MLATVSQTRSLVGSYIYDRALNQREKGGFGMINIGDLQKISTVPE